MLTLFSFNQAQSCPPTGEVINATALEKNHKKEHCGKAICPLPHYATSIQLSLRVIIRLLTFTEYPEGGKQFAKYVQSSPNLKFHMFTTREICHA